MKFFNWQYASYNDQLRLTAILMLMQHHPKLIRELFDPKRPRLRAAPHTLKRNSFSHGEKLLIKIALDLWNESGQAKLVELMDTLDPSNFQALIQAFEFIRNPGPIPTELFLDEDAIQWS